jgi:hypothetical protein
MIIVEMYINANDLAFSTLHLYPNGIMDFLIQI